MAGVPSRGGAGLAALRPPERLLGFVGNVAPRKPDIMQIARGPLRQLAPLAAAIAPNTKGLAELREKARTMMISHRYI
jgi:hypothetical protein